MSVSPSPPSSSLGSSPASSQASSPAGAEPTPVFVLGSIRSGTTLLQSLLDGHPELLVDAGESRFFPRTYPRVRFVTRVRRRSVAEPHLLYLFAQGSRYGEKFLQHVPPEDVRRAFYERFESSPGRPTDLLTSYLLAYGDASGQLTERTRYWVEKTPYHELHARRLLRWFPTCRAIYVARDPRDVFSSIKKRTRRKGKDASVRSFAFAWRKSVHEARWLGDRIGTSRMLFLRYEDLSRDPEAVMETVRSFLGIEAHPLLLQPTKGGGRVAWGGNPVSGERTEEVRPTVSYDWDELLDASERRTLAAELGASARFVGYDLPDASRNSLAAAFWAPVFDVATWLREVRFFLRFRL